MLPRLGNASIKRDARSTSTNREQYPSGVIGKGPTGSATTSSLGCKVCSKWPLGTWFETRHGRFKRQTWQCPTKTPASEAMVGHQNSAERLSNSRPRPAWLLRSWKKVSSGCRRLRSTQMSPRSSLSRGTRAEWQLRVRSRCRRRTPSLSRKHAAAISTQVAVLIVDAGWSGSGSAG